MSRVKVSKTDIHPKNISLCMIGLFLFRCWKRYLANFFTLKSVICLAYKPIQIHPVQCYCLGFKYLVFSRSTATV